MTIRKISRDMRECRQCGTIYHIKLDGCWPKEMMNCAVSDCRSGIRKDHAIRLRENVKE